MSSSSRSSRRSCSSRGSTRGVLYTIDRDRGKNKEKNEWLSVVSMQNTERWLKCNPLFWWLTEHTEKLYVLIYFFCLFLSSWVFFVYFFFLSLTPPRTIYICRIRDFNDVAVFVVFPRKLLSNKINGTNLQFEITTRRKAIRQ